MKRHIRFIARPYLQEAYGHRYMEIMILEQSHVGLEFVPSGNIFADPASGFLLRSYEYPDHAIGTDYASVRGVDAKRNRHTIVMRAATYKAFKHAVEAYNKAYG